MCDDFGSLHQLLYVTILEVMTESQMELHRVMLIISHENHSQVATLRVTSLYNAMRDHVWATFMINTTLCEKKTTTLGQHNCLMQGCTTLMMHAYSWKIETLQEEIFLWQLEWTGKEEAWMYTLFITKQKRVFKINTTKANSFTNITVKTFIRAKQKNNLSKSSLCQAW